MSTLSEQLRQRPALVIGSGVAAFVLVLAVGFGLTKAMGHESGHVNLAAALTETATQAPTPTPTSTPTPPPTPTPTPVSLAGAPFPPPPPRAGTPPGNDYGIKRIIAPRLHLDSYIEITPVVDGDMQAPVDGDYSVGYYPYFKVLPGESGNAVFSGHETWNHMQGPFYALHFAQPGDDIYVQMTDGREFHYQVMTYHRYDVNTMPMATIIDPPDRPFGESWITLITCGGRIVYDGTGFGEYLDRDVVVARIVK